MNEKARLFCAQCSASLEGQTVFATNGHTFCDNGTCKELFAATHYETRAHPARTSLYAQQHFELGNK